MTPATADARTLANKLCDLSRAEADRLFDTLPAVRMSALDGRFRGRLLAVSGFGWLPRFLRGPFYALLATPINPWRGKAFHRGSGANVWFTMSERFPFARYRVATDPSTGVEFLDYDIDENRGPLKRIRGEARQLDEQTVFARMNYRIGGKIHRVLYFTLRAS